MRLNDEATDAQRQRLLPFVTRLACADTPKIERERDQYIDAHIHIELYFSNPIFPLEFDTGLGVLEGALAIGRQADPLGMDEAASRLDAVRGSTKPARERSSSLPAKVKGWLGLQQAQESIG
jgi:hypothetical protein